MSPFEQQLRFWFSEFLTHRFKRTTATLPPLDGRPLLVFAPHQDDETLGCGGLIALKRRLGARVQVVFLTDGSASHPGHPVLTPTKLAALRRDEAWAALEILGVGRDAVRFLDGPDDAMWKLSAEQRAEYGARARAALDEFQPAQVAITYRGDKSQDHEACYTIVRDAVQAAGRPVEIWEYPIWILWWLRRGHLTQPDFAALRRLDISAVLPLKRRALECFRTQIDPTPPWTTNEGCLPDGFMRRFRDRWELFAVSPTGR